MTRRKQKPDYDWSGTTWDGKILDPDLEKYETGQLSQAEYEAIDRRKDYELYHLDREQWNKQHGKAPRKP